eukprot:TRINITY_DN4801_c0_g1_i3.p1 TRINITY_DN4801_c0_g1~~TRINITY_DN4801_c0_g1_i3.p1  ORF type:complete len:671 (+),score=120.63 TRINITY_DN4801_c0_g1_i3:274-2013(+)
MATSDPARPTNSSGPPVTDVALSKTKKERVQSAASAAAVGGAVGALVGGATSGGSAGKIALLQDFGCAGGEDAMSWELHPTQLGIGGGPEKELIGACIMNMLLLLGLSVVMVGAAGGVRAATGQSWEEARAAVRFPGICYIPYLFLLQGTSLAAARALFYPGGSVAIGLIGGATAFFSLSVPVLIHIRVVRAPSGKVVPDGAAVQMSGWQKFLYSFTFGNAIWVSAKEPLFCERFGVIFETVKKDALWCLPAECLGVIMLSVLSALQPGTVWMCNMRNLGLALTTALWFLVLVVKRPYFGYLEGLVNTGAAGLVFVAVVCMTVAIWGEVAPDHILLEVAAETLSVSGWMVVGKALWDVAGYLYDTCSGLKRTKRARAEARGGDEQEELVSVNGSQQRMVLSSCDDALPVWEGYESKRQLDGEHVARSSFDVTSGEEIAALDDDLIDASRTSSFFPKGAEVPSSAAPQREVPSRYTPGSSSGNFVAFLPAAATPASPHRKQLQHTLNRAKSAKVCSLNVAASSSRILLASPPARSHSGLSIDAPLTPRRSLTPTHALLRSPTLPRRRGVSASPLNGSIAI